MGCASGACLRTSCRASHAQPPMGDPAVQAGGLPTARPMSPTPWANHAVHSGGLRAARLMHNRLAHIQLNHHSMAQRHHSMSTLAHIMSLCHYTRPCPAPLSCHGMSFSCQVESCNATHVLTAIKSAMAFHRAAHFIAMPCGVSCHGLFFISTGE